MLILVVEWNQGIPTSMTHQVALSPYKYKRLSTALAMTGTTDGDASSFVTGRVVLGLLLGGKTPFMPLSYA